jgi:nucleotide-binding universal stress UspA family protein
MPILAAIDLGRTTASVLRHADRHARAANDELVVCHVGSPREDPEVIAHTEPITGRSHAEFESVVVPGAPAAEILRTAAWHSAGMVVVGESRHTGVRRWFRRGTMRGVLRRSTIPVLVARDSPPTGHIVVATELLDATFPVIGAAAREAKLFGASTRVTALHCIDAPVHGTLEEADGWPDYLPTRYRAGVVRAKENLDAALRTHQLDAEPQIVLGSLHKTIVAAATQVGAELVVIGSHRRSTLDRMIAGSLSEHVAACARCAVLVVPIAPVRVLSRTSSPQPASV